MKYEFVHSLLEKINGSFEEIWRPTQLIAGDEIIVDREKGSLSFWRSGHKLRSRHVSVYGIPDGEIVLSFFPMTHEDAVRSVALAASFARCGYEAIDADASHFILTEKSSENPSLIETIESGDVLEIDLHGRVSLTHGSLRLVREGEESVQNGHVQTWELFPFCCNGEVLGVIELISAIRRCDLVSDRNRAEDWDHKWDSCMKYTLGHGNEYTSCMRLLGSVAKKNPSTHFGSQPQKAFPHRRALSA